MVVKRIWASPSEFQISDLQKQKMFYKAGKDARNVLFQPYSSRKWEQRYWISPITLLISDKAGVVNTWFYRLNLLIFFFICQINPLLAPDRVSEKWQGP